VSIPLDEALFESELKKKIKEEEENPVKKWIV
jgi:hypothetical protein